MAASAKLGNDERPFSTSSPFTSSLPACLLRPLAASLPAPACPSPGPPPPTLSTWLWSIHSMVPSTAFSSVALSSGLSLSATPLSFIVLRKL